MNSLESPLLEVRNLHTVFPSNGKLVHAVDSVNLTLNEGEIVGVVGESGCGKSTLLLSLLRLLRYPGRVEGGQVRFRGRDLLELNNSEM
ncbi:MAG: ATP-binding cassette domain-containing protein, partial [Thioalkalivibrio sp.]|nr:ATP-binding cassette domain-containing protein [Thioalkalivibrio sp.]